MTPGDTRNNNLSSHRPIILISLLLSSHPIRCVHPLHPVPSNADHPITLQRKTILTSSAILPSLNTMEIWKMIQFDLYSNHLSNWFILCIMNLTPSLKKNLPLNVSFLLQLSSLFSLPLLLPSQSIFYTLDLHFLMSQAILNTF